MIDVMHLTKQFGAKTAVDAVTFQVEKGEILGFLGPNAAGKSTTMRMITGFIPPTSGTAAVGGHDVVTDGLAARREIGYLPENAPVYPDMTVTAYLDFCAEIRGFSGADRRKRVAETIEKCFLEDVRFQTINTLSKGFKQRVCFAQSIIHDPPYLILDEPTDGLDPNQKHEVRMMIRRMSTEKAIILSTHILDEVDAVCTRAIIIAGGRIVADDTPAGLKARSELHGAVTLSIPTAVPDGLLPQLQAVAGVKSARLLDDSGDGPSLRVFPEHPGEPIIHPVIAALAEHQLQPTSIFVEKGRLDEVFRDITTR